MNSASPAAIFVSSFIIGLSGALMPGPLLAVAVRDSARRGITAAPLLVLGHGILEAALVALILLGLAEWLKGEAAMAVISLLGGAALLWMAVGMAREARTLKAPGAGQDGQVPREPRMAGAAAEGDVGSGIDRAGADTSGPARSVLDGIVVSVSNPYWSFWWATVGLAYVVVARSLGAAGIAAFFAGHILSDFAWYMAVGFAVCMGRGRLSDRFYRGVVGCCAACLVFFALWFGYRGLTALVRLS